MSANLTVGDLSGLSIEFGRWAHLRRCEFCRAPQVPTRVNSPWDVEFVVALPSQEILKFTTAIVVAEVYSSEHCSAGGHQSQPGQTTGGNGQITGQEVLFKVNFTTPFTLQPDHYFFIPQVEMDPANGVDGDFLWLSANRRSRNLPAGFTDLQTWTRDEMLDPDWLRIGKDIVGLVNGSIPTFNAAFSLDGTARHLFRVPCHSSPPASARWVCSAGAGNGSTPPDLIQFQWQGNPRAKR